MSHSIWRVWPQQETSWQATVFNYGSDEIRRTCLLQNVPGSSAVEETDAHNQLGLFASDSHTHSSESTAHLGHLFSICISKQSSRETEQAPWKLILKEQFAIRTFVTPKQTGFEMLHDY